MKNSGLESMLTADKYGGKNITMNIKQELHLLIHK